MGNIGTSKITPEQRAIIEAEAEKAIGFTPERAAQFLNDSTAEAATDGEKDFRGDAIGKFKHFLRVERHWGGAVDAAWPFLEPYAAAVVDAVLKAQGEA